jgi:hypothetical protein
VHAKFRCAKKLVQTSLAYQAKVLTIERGREGVTNPLPACISWSLKGTVWGKNLQYLLYIESRKDSIGFVSTIF